MSIDLSQTLTFEVIERMVENIPSVKREIRNIIRERTIIYCQILGYNYKSLFPMDETQWFESLIEGDSYHYKPEMEALKKLLNVNLKPITVNPIKPKNRKPFYTKFLKNAKR